MRPRSRVLQDRRVDLEHREEAEEVDRFKADSAIPVFLLTTQVAGLGWLTEADRVVVVDPAWNPLGTIRRRQVSPELSLSLSFKNANISQRMRLS